MSADETEKFSVEVTTIGGTKAVIDELRASDRVSDLFVKIGSALVIPPSASLELRIADARCSSQDAGRPLSDLGIEAGVLITATVVPDCNMVFYKEIENTNGYLQRLGVEAPTSDIPKDADQSPMKGQMESLLLSHEGSCTLVVVNETSRSVLGGPSHHLTYDVLMGRYDFQDEATRRAVNCSWHKHLRRNMGVGIGGVDASTPCWKTQDAEKSANWQHIVLPGPDAPAQGESSGEWRRFTKDVEADILTSCHKGVVGLKPPYFLGLKFHRIVDSPLACRHSAHYGQYTFNTPQHTNGLDLDGFLLALDDSQKQSQGGCCVS